MLMSYMSTLSFNSFRRILQTSFFAPWWNSQIAAVGTMPPKKQKLQEEDEAETEEQPKGAEETAEQDEEIEKPPPAKRARGRPKKTEAIDEDKPKKKQGKPKKEESTDGGAASKPSASAKPSKPTAKTDWSSVKWSELGQTKDGRPWNKKFSTWNVNGIRAWLKNGGFEYISQEDPDIFCLQETKCAEAELPKSQLDVPGYHVYWYSADKKGYSGTGMYTKEKPLKVTLGMDIDKHDNEGRLITAEFDKYFFITSYVPNAGEGLKRLAYRQEWDKDLRAYLKSLDEQKPIIFCGDLNVAHNEIDLARPKNNTGTAGFTEEEREGFTELLKQGFVDSFRHLYPERKDAYSYWSYRFNCRSKNLGWRLDYFVLSERLVKDVTDCVIRSEVYGSDHCPLVLGLAIE